VVGFCQHGNESSASIKTVELLDQLSNYQQVKEDTKNRRRILCPHRFAMAAGTWNEIRRTWLYLSALGVYIRKYKDVLTYTFVSLCFNWAPPHEGVLEGVGIAQRILNLSTRWRWVVSFVHRSLYSQGKSPWYPVDRRMGGAQSRSGRGGEEKNSQALPGLEPQIIQSVAQPVSWLSYRLDNRGSIPCRARYLRLLAPHPDLLLGPPRLLSKGYLK
jgi:hypothetical protein